MMVKNFLLLAFATSILILSACSALPHNSTPQILQPQKPPVVSEPEIIPPPPMKESPLRHASCDSENVHFVMGKMASTDLLEELRQKTGALVVRVLQPNQPISREFDPTRVNVHLNANYVIQEVTCF